MNLPYLVAQPPEGADSRVSRGTGFAEKGREYVETRLIDGEIGPLNTVRHSFITGSKAAYDEALHNRHRVFER